MTRTSGAKIKPIPSLSRSQWSSPRWPQIGDPMGQYWIQNRQPWILVSTGTPRRSYPRNRLSTATWLALQPHIMDLEAQWLNPMGHWCNGHQRDHHLGRDGHHHHHDSPENPWRQLPKTQLQLLNSVWFSPAHPLLIGGLFLICPDRHVVALIPVTNCGVYNIIFLPGDPISHLENQTAVCFNLSSSLPLNPGLTKTLPCWSFLCHPKLLPLDLLHLDNGSNHPGSFKAWHSLCQPLPASASLSAPATPGLHQPKWFTANTSRLPGVPQSTSRRGFPSSGHSGASAQLFLGGVQMTFWSFCTALPGSGANGFPT